jgi:hypothetical protein
MDFPMTDGYSSDPLLHFFNEPFPDIPIMETIEPQNLLTDTALPADDALFFGFVQMPNNEVFETQSNFESGNIQLTQSTGNATTANTRKRKAPTLRVEDWEPYKARVIELHIDQNRPLPEVKAIMENSGFKAEYVSNQMVNKNY